MSRTNCLRPSKGFCLNLRVRTVNSDIAAAANGRRQDRGTEGGALPERLEPTLA